MHRGLLVAALVALATLVGASPATAGGHRSQGRHHRRTPVRHPPAHGARCRRHHKVSCVRRHAPRAVELHAHLDPTFTRDRLDPFKITYTYSASATKKTAGSSAEEPAPPPAGVLSLVSDGRLDCAVFVGAGVKGSRCTVDYAKLGRHRVRVVYTSGERSATESRIESVPQLANELWHVASAFEAARASTVQPALVEANRATLVGLLTTDVLGQDAPAIAATLGCGGDVAPESLSSSDCYQATGFTEYVYARSRHPCSVGIEGVFISSKTDPARVDGFEFSPAEIESGTDHLRVRVPAGDGYATSEETVPIKFRLPSLC